MTKIDEICPKHLRLSISIWIQFWLYMHVLTASNLRASPLTNDFFGACRISHHTQMVCSTSWKSSLSLPRHIGSGPCRRMRPEFGWWVVDGIWTVELLGSQTQKWQGSRLEVQFNMNWYSLILTCHTCGVVLKGTLLFGDSWGNHWFLRYHLGACHTRDWHPHCA